MPTPSKEARVILALEAVQNDKDLSLRAAARLYNIPYNTLRDRHAGKPARRDFPANSRNLTDLEEQTIVQYVIELSACAFPPRLCGVEDMANHLRRECNAPPVGKRWAHNFVKRQLELRTRYSRRYDYQRAKCEDPKVIGEWFTLVRNVKCQGSLITGFTCRGRWFSAAVTQRILSGETVPIRRLPLTVWLMSLLCCKAGYKG